MIPPHIDTWQPSPTLLLNANPPTLLIGSVAFMVARPRVLVVLSSLLVRGQGNADWLIRVARAPASFSGDPVKSKFFSAHQFCGVWFRLVAWIVQDLHIIRNLASAADTDSQVLTSEATELTHGKLSRDTFR